MIPKVIEAKVARDFALYRRFSNGTEGDIDLRDKLDGDVFAPLRNPACFRKARVYPELHTVVWPNGADFASEYLYERMQVTA